MSGTRTLDHSSLRPLLVTRPVWPNQPFQATARNEPRLNGSAFG